MILNYIYYYNYSSFIYLFICVVFTQFYIIVKVIKNQAYCITICNISIDNPFFVLYVIKLVIHLFY